MTRIPVMKLIGALLSSLAFGAMGLWSSPAPSGFVRIKGGVFEAASGELVRLEPFEILDHPVTNAEYRVFVSATGHAPPLHWAGGAIPEGFEDHPVIFVNRDDVAAYLEWLSGREGRIYRLPTDKEFEFASRGGRTGKHPWGDGPPEGRANFDAKGARAFDQWRSHLEPARGGEPNGYGLWGMAGNVWNMVEVGFDPAIVRFRYRIVNPPMNEPAVMGGSWAYGEEGLRCGAIHWISAGIRFPDLGFRPAREPDGENWRAVNRRLVAQQIEGGAVFLSWSSLAEDPEGLAFDVYRLGPSKWRDHAGFRVTESPIVSGTSFRDETVSGSEGRFHYYVKEVPQGGAPGRRSFWASVTASAKDSPAAQLATFEPLYRQGSITPVFGDLDGDGTLDCVTRLDNGIREGTSDRGLRIEMEAFASHGKSLWRRDLCGFHEVFGNANNAPFVVWDMDGDGRAEVLARMAIGESVVLAMLDGMTGEILDTAPWPDMITDIQRSSSRIHLAIAYLDGERPFAVAQTGLYENERLTAFDANLEVVWDFKSLGETNGSGSHRIVVEDVDGDGRDEVFDGTTCLNADGTVRWSLYRRHADHVFVQDFLSDREGLEVCFIVETSMHAGIYMASADTGELIWKRNRQDDPAWTHGHHGWAADIFEGAEGIELISNRAGHGDRNFLAFSPRGLRLFEGFPHDKLPFEWDGDATRELVEKDGSGWGEWDGQRHVPLGRLPGLALDAKVLMAADLYGDFRDELVVEASTEDGGRRIAVIAAQRPLGHRRADPKEDRSYRLWIARNLGGGYAEHRYHPLGGR